MLMINYLEVKNSPCRIDKRQKLKKIKIIIIIIVRALILFECNMMSKEAAHTIFFNALGCCGQCLNR